jgi:hypothetical protein
MKSWDVDLRTFNMDIVLTSTLGKERLRSFAFVEMEPESQVEDEPGLRDSLQDRRIFPGNEHE